MDGLDIAAYLRMAMSESLPKGSRSFSKVSCLEPSFSSSSEFSSEFEAKSDSSSSSSSSIDGWYHKEQDFASAQYLVLLVEVPLGLLKSTLVLCILLGRLSLSLIDMACVLCIFLC
ncbi:hypothetical protein PanWU01x14_052820 [Parasponia andersonii]|uniref:Uncharacterized protein n=1 Tax=Parasponia andersonii TaxID=3476 RepID=A0A2P5DL98_PARAD|nr:hypothetical protein PanWU01x14_052820 [Parasponia andersonii]